MTIKKLWANVVELEEKSASEVDVGCFSKNIGIIDLDLPKGTENGPFWKSEGVETKKKKKSGFFAFSARKISQNAPLWGAKHAHGPSASVHPLTPI